MNAQDYLDRANYVELLKNDKVIEFSATPIDSANYKIDLKFPTGTNVKNLMISWYRNSNI